MLMPGEKRNWASNSYRYGFQGQEMDNEQKGVGNVVNYTFRALDSRIGRFFSVDPLTAEYPYYSPYAFSGNRVIDAFEIEGLEPSKNGTYSGQGEVAAEYKGGNKIKGTDNQRWVWNKGAWGKQNVTVTNSELKTLFPSGTSSNLKTLETTLNLDGASYGIKSFDHIAHYLAQAGKETGGFSSNATAESLKYYSLSRVKAVYGYSRSIYATILKAQETTNKYNLHLKMRGSWYRMKNYYFGNSERFANLAYANILGNGDEASGDGFAFRGRGYFQLTGRANYAAFTKFYNSTYGTKLDFTKTPLKLSNDRDIAIKSSLWFFKTYTLPSVKKGRTFSQITKTVNAAGLGLTGRQKIYNDAKKLLK